MKRNKKILSVLIVLLFLVAGWYILRTDTKRKSDTEVESSSCKAMHLEMVDIEGLSAVIVAKPSYKEVESPVVLQLNTISDIGYGYVASTSIVDRPYYVVVELCDGDTEKSLSYTHLEGGDWNHIIQSDFGGESSQANYTDIVNGEGSSLLSNSGEYVVYVYASFDGDEWFVADSVSFKVE
jgi:hypothetical protein